MRLLAQLKIARPVVAKYDWQGRFIAVDKDGKPVPPAHGSVRGLSIYGVLRRVGVQSPKDRGKLIKMLCAEIPGLDIADQIPAPSKFATYLDALWGFETNPATKKEHVLRLFDLAIARLEKV